MATKYNRMNDNENDDDEENAINEQKHEFKQAEEQKQPQPDMERQPTVEEVSLKFEKSVHPFLPKLKTLQSAIFKLYPDPIEIEKNTVHQIWIQGEEHLKKTRAHMYKNYVNNQKLQNGKNFLWSEEMIESLIVHEYKQLLTLYHSYSHFIMRVDLAKYIILYHYGGFYVDMDSVCKKNFESLAAMSKDGKQAIVCEVTDDHRTKLYSKKFINNHFFYLPHAKHPLMKIMLREAPISAKRKALEPMILYILRAVGPGFLMHCLKKYKQQINDERKSKLSVKEKIFYKKVKTDDIVTVIDSVVLNGYFEHESTNTWLEDQWMDSKDSNDYLLVLGAVSVFLGSAQLIVAPYIKYYR